MGLTDKLHGARKYAEPVKNKEHFRKLYLEDLINSKELRPYFFDGGKRKEDDRAKMLYSELTRIVDDNYDNYGRKNYEKKGFFRRFIAKPLRMIGSGLAAAGHYLLNVYLSPEAYAVAMIPALGMMAAADAIEGVSYLYHNHSGYDLLQVPKLVLEGVLEKGLAIIPGIVTPAAEATLGNTKFDRAVARKILYKSRNEFIKKFGEYKKPEDKDKYKLRLLKIPRKDESELKKAA